MTTPTAWSFTSFFEDYVEKRFVELGADPPKNYRGYPVWDLVPLVPVHPKAGDRAEVAERLETEIKRLDDTPPSIQSQANIRLINAVHEAVAILRSQPIKEDAKGVDGEVERLRVLDLSNLIRHAFLSGFEAAGKTVTEGISYWPHYNPEQSYAYQRVCSALDFARAALRKEGGE